MIFNFRLFAAVFLMLPFSSSGAKSGDQQSSPAQAASSGKLSLRSLQDVSQFATLKHFSRPLTEPSAANKWLSFKMEPQEHGNWCWAANAKSVSKFYSNRSTWSQCKIAGAELGSDCCGSYSDQTCNKTWYLNRSFKRTGNFAATQTCVPQTGPCHVLSFGQVFEQIELGRPVGVRIGWKGGGGHFVVIYGFKNDASAFYYYVDDPIYGPGPPISEDDLKSSYQYTGSWTHSYYTAPPEGSAVVAAGVNVSKNAAQAVLNIEPARVPPVPIGFKLAPIDERYAGITANARSLLSSERSETKSADGKQFTLAVPHDVYVGELSELAKPASALPEKPSGTRVLEMADGKLSATYDLKSIDGKPPALISGRNSQPFVGVLSDSLQNALTLSERAPESPELRLLTVPGLYFEALWLHYKNDKDDTFIPILSPDFAVNKPIGRAELLEALRALAQKRLEAEPSEP